MAETDAPEESKKKEQDPATIVSYAMAMAMSAVFEAIRERDPDTAAFISERLKAIRQQSFAKASPKSMEFLEIYIKLLEPKNAQE